MCSEDLGLRLLHAVKTVTKFVTLLLQGPPRTLYPVDCGILDFRPASLLDFLEMLTSVHTPFTLASDCSFIGTFPCTIANSLAGDTQISSLPNSMQNLLCAVTNDFGL